MITAKFKELQESNNDVLVRFGDHYISARVKRVSTVEALTTFAKDCTRVRFVAEVSASTLAPIQHHIIRGFSSDMQHFSQFGNFPASDPLPEYAFHQSVALDPVMENGNYLWVFELDFLNE